jgi:hypothetical protein
MRQPKMPDMVTEGNQYIKGFSYPESQKLVRCLCTVTLTEEAAKRQVCKATLNSATTIPYVSRNQKQGLSE